MSLYPRGRSSLFSLMPLNERAKNVANHPRNKYIASELSDGTIVLDIGFHIHSRSNHTLATLGRGNDTDIYVDGIDISRIQCSFEIEPTNVVMLYDRSHSLTTQVSGTDATPFEHGRRRQIVVRHLLNDILGMGGKTQDAVRFQLIWKQNHQQTTEIIREREALANELIENPRLARTTDDLETVLPSQMQTRIHTPGPRQLEIRYTKVDQLGAGHFGVVHKVINVDTGKFLAVKIFEKPEQASKEAGWRQSLYYALKREVETLSQISHPHIIDFIGSQGWDGPAAEIFMGLKDGTLASLVRSNIPSLKEVTRCALHQMLQALDCLDVNGIVHRDVKPENILYTALPDAQYRFQLGDFGLCNRTVIAQSSVGSPLYAAPEVHYHGVQSHKMDVWSLFVTIAWALDFHGFRQNLAHFETLQQAQQALLNISTKIGEIQEMARVDPDERASAAQMLVKCFDGKGLSTKRNRVLPLSPTKPETRTGPDLHSVPMSTDNYGLAQGTQNASQQPTNLTRVRQPSTRVSGPGIITRLPAKKLQLLSNVVESPGFRQRFQVPPSND